MVFWRRERASEKEKATEERVLLTITEVDVKSFLIGSVVGMVVGIFMAFLLVLALPYLTSPMR